MSLTVPAEQGDQYLVRLAAVRDTCRDLGYGVWDDMNDMLVAQGFMD